MKDSEHRLVTDATGNVDLAALRTEIEDTARRLEDEQEGRVQLTTVAEQADLPPRCIPVWARRPLGSSAVRVIVPAVAQIEITHEDGNIETEMTRDYPTSAAKLRDDHVAETQRLNG